LAETVLAGFILVPVAEENYCYYYYIHLAAFFEDNLGKPTPER